MEQLDLRLDKKRLELAKARAKSTRQKLAYTKALSKVNKLLRDMN